MSFKTSQHWKRIAQTHWDLTEDEFSSSLAESPDVQDTVIEVALSNRNSDGFTQGRRLLFFLFAVFLGGTAAVWKSRRDNLLSSIIRKCMVCCEKIVAAITGDERTSPTKESAEQASMSREEEGAISPRKQTMISEHEKPPGRLEKRQHDNEQPQYHANSVARDASSDNLFKSTKTICLGKDAPPPEKIHESSLVVIQTRLEDCPLNAVLPDDDPPLLEKELEHPLRSKSFGSVVSDRSLVQQEAEEAAKRISITRESFAKYELPPSLAAEFAMRRHLSDFSESSRRKEEYIRQHIEERRHQESISAMQCDSNWLEKIVEAYNKCWNAEIRSASYSLIFAVLLELYLKSPNAYQFVELITECTCGSGTPAEATQLSRVWGDVTSVLYWYTPVAVSKHLTYIATPIYIIRCVWPFAAALMSMNLMSFVGLRPPQFVQNLLLLTWFLQSELALMGADMMWNLVWFHVAPQAILATIIFCVAYRHRLQTIWSIRRRGLNFQPGILEESLVKFEEFRMWCSVLPFFLACARFLFSFHGNKWSSDPGSSEIWSAL